MENKIPNWFAKCKALEVEEKEIESNRKVEFEKKMEEDRIKENEQQKLAEKGEICVCEVDINCKFCFDVFESEQNLDEPNPFSKEEDLAFEKQELEAYRKHIREERNEKRRKKVELARQPMKALPEREMCAYERIREDNIAQRKREWAIFESELEKKEMEKKEKTMEEKEGSSK